MAAGVHLTNLMTKRVASACLYRTNWPTAFKCGTVLNRNRTVSSSLPLMQQVLFVVRCPVPPRAATC